MNDRPVPASCPAERGKPAEYGQEIVRRRSRLTAARLSMEGKLVLDFGCGNGAQAVEFLAGRCRMVAVDIDEGDLRVFSDYLRAHTISTILPVRYDGGSLPLRDASVDVAVSFEVLEHVRSEEVALSEVLRVLKPGGDFILSVPNKWWIFETHGARLPLLPWNRVPFFSWLPDAIHSRFARARIYRRKQIINLLEKQGFQVKETTYVTAPLDVVPSPFLRRLLRRIIFRGDETKMPLLSTAILIHARR